MQQEPHVQTSVHSDCGRGSVLIWRRCNMWRISGFVDDVLFPITGADGMRLLQRLAAVSCMINTSDERYLLRLSVTLVDIDHIGWTSSKLIAWTISPTYSLFVAQRSSTYSQGNMEKFWGENVRSKPTSITYGWIESTESHVILGGGVAVCLLLSAHCAVIFAIAQLSCSDSSASAVVKVVGLSLW